MIRFLIAFAVIALCFWIFTRTCRIWYLNQARRMGKLPPEKATLFDVKKLIERGEKELAVSLYQSIFGTDKKEAARAVDEMERSLNN